MRIDVWSDVVCPWCYLGKRRLDAALDRVGDQVDVEVHWRAYQLDPTATAEPKPLGPAIDKKYGPGSFEGMKARLVPMGAEVGIDYRFDDAQRVSSVDALRLVAWAESEGAEPATVDALHEALFRSYFTDGTNIADHGVLARVAGEVGLDGSLVPDVLAGPAGRQQVHDDLVAAADRQITGVPAFVLNDAFLIPGAQDVDTMAIMIQRAHERLG